MKPYYLDMATTTTTVQPYHPVDLGNSSASTTADNLNYSIGNDTEPYCNLSSDRTLWTLESCIEFLNDYIFPVWYEWIFIVLHMAVFVVGLIGNALVCMSVYRNHSMRTVTNYFIVNLAVADFLVILVCLPPTVLWDVTETWMFGDVMCKLVLYVQNVSVSVSIMTLTFISVDRWYAICYPLRSMSTPARAKVAIMFIWLLSFVLVLPYAILMKTVSYMDDPYLRMYLTDCDFTWPELYTTYYQIILVVILYLIPFLLMSLVYYHIAKVLWDRNIPGSMETSAQRRPPRSDTNDTCRNGAMRMSGPNTSGEGQIRARRKAAKMLIAVVVIFGLCYLPVHALNTLRIIIDIPQTDWTTAVSLLSHWLCYFNSAINPIIYNFMSGKFRREFRNSFICVRVGSFARGRSTTRTCVCRYTSSVTQFDNIPMNSMLPD